MKTYFAAKKPLEELLCTIFQSKMFNMCYEIAEGLNITFHEEDYEEGIYDLEIRLWEDGSDTLPAFYAPISIEEIEKIRTTLIKVYGGSMIYDEQGNGEMLIKSNVFKNANDYSLGFIEVVDGEGNYLLEENVAAQIELNDDLSSDNYIMCLIGKAKPPLTLVG